jgi:hypothetical protein
MAEIVNLRTSPVPSLKSGDGGGTFDDMEARVKALESSVSEIKADLKTILKDTSEIKGKLSNMPATWQIVTMFVAMFALVITSGGALISLLRYTAAGS